MMFALTRTGMATAGDIAPALTGVHSQAARAEAGSRRELIRDPRAAANAGPLRKPG